jgi:hypothetical protein
VVLVESFHAKTHAAALLAAQTLSEGIKVPHVSGAASATTTIVFGETR